MPPCISTALSLAVLNDTSGGRAVIVSVTAILHKPRPTDDADQAHNDPEEDQ
jgi:hypothetical protein